MSDPIRDAVAFCISDHHGHWLQVRRPDHSPGGGQVGFPAGKLEPGETQQQAVIRECFEELGVIATPKKHLTTIDLPEWGIRLHAWLTTIKGDLTPNEREVAEILWMSRSAITTHPTELRSSRLIAEHLPR